jgi:hypothetical protein
MTPTYLQSISGNDAGTGTCVLTLPNPVTVGSGILVVAGNVGSMSVTDIEGNTYVDLLGGIGIDMLARLASSVVAGATTVTVSSGVGTGFGVSVFEYSDVTGFKQIATNEGTTATPPPTPITTTEADLVFTALSGTANTVAGSTAPGYTVRETTPLPVPDIITADITGPAGVYSPAWTLLVPAPDNYIVATIALTSNQPLTITGNFPSGSTNAPYAGGVTAHGGVPPYSYSLFSGTLPPGLVLNTVTGTVTGTPTTGGTYNFTIEATDSTLATITFSVTLFINLFGPIFQQSNSLANTAPNCLPEARRLYTAIIDFATFEPTPIPKVNPPYINFPELTINEQSADGPARNDSISYYQVVNLTPGSSSQPANGSQQIGLSCVKGMLFYYRPTFGFQNDPGDQGGDFAYTPEEIGLLLVTNVTTAQTIAIPGPPLTANVNGNPVINGSFPFYASPTDVIRVLKLNEGSKQGYGKLTLQFTNFDVPAYSNAVLATLDQ